MDFNTPAEASHLQWPSAFVDSTMGERLELSEDGACSTRHSGVGRGTCFVGPLTMEKDLTYFEVEIVELEPNRSQTMALGFCHSLPTGNRLLSERASELGRGSYLVGYDLPKLHAHGLEATKIPTKQWRPLKELAVGDRVGLMANRVTRELIVFVNGLRKASVIAPSLSESQQVMPVELFGVVDVYGTVKSVRLRKRGRRPFMETAETPVQAQPPAAVTTSRMSPPSAHVSKNSVGRPTIAESARPNQSDDKPGERAIGGADSKPVQQCVRDGDCSETQGDGTHTSSVRRGLEATLDEVARPAKRLKLQTHPCGCTVHLICHTGTVVHVPRTDFLIGRNPQCANLRLDSPLVPNMVSRRHARIVSSDNGVEIHDCKSLNGTWVNGAKADRQTLEQGDLVVIGNPNQGTSEFRFTVSLP